jgi:long-chain acyl-CoA synthetase
MAREFFEPHFFRDGYRLRQRLGNDVLYGLATLFFNAFPLPRTQPGARETLRYMGELLDDGWSVLIYPEGHRTEHGDIRPFESGVGLIASRLRVPVVPVRLSGVDRVLHHTWRWPHRGPVGVAFGPALVLEGSDYPALAQRVEQAVRALPPRVADTGVDSHAA